MNPDKVVLPIVRSIGQHPWLSNALFRFAKYDPFDPQRYSWPYPVYDQMSRGEPVVYSRVFKEWTVFGYDEVLDVLRSPDVSTAGVITRIRAIAPYNRLSPRAIDNFARWLLFVDPPDHTRLRSAVSRTFTPKRIAEHEPRIRAIAEQLLADLAHDPNPDVIAGFASPLPVYAIADILGVPHDQFDMLHRASAEYASLLGILQPFAPDSIVASTSPNCRNLRHADRTTPTRPEGRPHHSPCKRSGQRTRQRRHHRPHRRAHVRRPRNDHRPDRQRPHRTRRVPGPTITPAQEARAARQRHRRTPPLRPTSPNRRPNHHRPRPSRQHHHPDGSKRGTHDRSSQPHIRHGPTPTSSASTAPTPNHSHSATASTTASEPH